MFIPVRLEDGKYELLKETSNPTKKELRRCVLTLSAIYIFPTTKTLCIHLKS